MAVDIWKNAPATSDMIMIMENLTMDKGVEPVIAVATLAYRAMPFSLTDSKDKNSQTLIDFLKNVSLLEQVTQAKGQLAIAANTVLTRAYTHFEGRILPKYSDRCLDISDTYWDEVQNKINDQFVGLDDSFKFNNFVNNMWFGFSMRIKTYPNGRPRNFT